MLNKCLLILFMNSALCFGAEAEKKETDAKLAAGSNTSLTGYKEATEAFFSAVEANDEDKQRIFMAKMSEGMHLESELWKAVKTKDHAKVRILLEKGADPNAEGPIVIDETEFGMKFVSCFSIALANQDKSTAELLLQAKADLPSKFELSKVVKFMDRI